MVSADDGPSHSDSGAAVVAVLGGGPAGLMAAERLAAAGCDVTVYEAMPTPARKFLMAGRGGLNITHSAPAERFVQAYGEHAADIASALDVFPPAATIAWLHDLGIETFTGSSGRVFPRSMKASPVLRAWLGRLERLGVRLAVRHRWIGFAGDGRLLIERPDETVTALNPDATVLALGGASWPRLGATGAWAATLAAEGIDVAPLRPANCGITIAWSPRFAKAFAGTPLKRIAVTVDGDTVRGEAIITARGLEGGAIYAIARRVRDLSSDPSSRGNQSSVQISLDLRPDESEARLTQRLSVPRGRQSTSTYLRKSLRLDPVSIGLLHEAIHQGAGTLVSAPQDIAARVKAVSLTATGVAGLDRAISTAGGVRFHGLDGSLMLEARPGVFVAGEMLDWEAPTGGFLLQATLATAVQAADGALAFLERTGKLAVRPQNGAVSAAVI